MTKPQRSGNCSDIAHLETSFPPCCAVCGGTKGLVSSATNSHPPRLLIALFVLTLYLTHPGGQMSIWVASPWRPSAAGCTIPATRAAFLWESCGPTHRCPTLLCSQLCCFPRSRSRVSGPKASCKTENREKERQLGNQILPSDMGAHMGNSCLESHHSRC